MVGKGFDLRVWRVGVLRDGMRGMSGGVNCEGREGGLCSICINIIDIAYRTLCYRECEGEVVGKRGGLNLNQKPSIEAKQSKEHSIFFILGKIAYDQAGAVASMCVPYHVDPLAE